LDSNQNGYLTLLELKSIARNALRDQSKDQNTSGQNSKQKVSLNNVLLKLKDACNRNILNLQQKFATEYDTKNNGQVPLYALEEVSKKEKLKLSKGDLDQIEASYQIKATEFIDYEKLARDMNAARPEAQESIMQESKVAKFGTKSIMMPDGKVVQKSKGIFRGPKTKMLQDIGTFSPF
jgi:hypothetical protein